MNCELNALHTILLLNNFKLFCEEYIIILVLLIKNWSLQNLSDIVKVIN